MQPYEIAGLIKYRTYRGRDDWERARVISCNMLRPWSKGDFAPQDVMRFPWDEEREDEETTTAMSEADRLRLPALAKDYEKILNNGN